MVSSQPALNPALDRDSLARAFREKQRLHIPDFIHQAFGERLLAFLAASDAWTLVMNHGDKLLELNRAIQADISAAKQVQIDQAIYAAATHGFQFRYENIRVRLDESAETAPSTPLVDFARFLESEEMLEFFRAVTGFADLGFVDARATAYGPGHFLTSHNDDAHDQQRRVAYVFNLAKDWNVDWGGLLTFHDKDSRIVEAYVPAFGALNLFRVPRQHSVSFVTPFAAGLRYSVTGWLHAGTRP